MPLDQLRFLVPGFRDVVEILVVAYLIYRALLFLAGTRALQILIGLVILGGVYFFALLLKFTMVATLLGMLFTYGAFAAIVVFQPELRHALARLGRTRAFNILVYNTTDSTAEEIASAAERLSRAGTGAIIAIEGEVSLDDYVETGTRMRASVSGELVSTIFTPYSPLHDGAVIVRGDEIIGAGCVLPLTQFPVTDKSLGTRHRAALGLSEESDAVVIVVSEETSRISLARGGLLKQGVTPDEVRETLTSRRGGPLAFRAPPGEPSAA
jgi:diadenylate cyclase